MNILKLVLNSILDNYDIRNNKGYGTKSHMEALKEFGPTNFLRNLLNLVKWYSKIVKNTSK